MGLFSGLQRLAQSAVSSVTQVAAAALPIASLAFPGFGAIAGQFLGPALGLGAPPSAAGGAQAVVQANLAMRAGCPPPGLQGSRSPFANPITRAATTPGFDVNRLPARPVFGAGQVFRSQLPPPAQPFQGESLFRQRRFGAPVRPTFRPFGPSFRSGRAALPERFDPRTLGPPIPPSRFTGGFGGFGGLGGFGF